MNPSLRAVTGHGQMDPVILHRAKEAGATYPTVTVETRITAVHIKLKI